MSTKSRKTAGNSIFTGGGNGVFVAKNQISAKNLIIFAAIFAAIGTIIILKSFAATTLTATQDATAPSAPAGAIISSVSRNQVSFYWTPSTDTGGSGLAGYNIYRGNSPTSITTKLNTTLVTATSYGDPTVQPSTGYFYQIEAVDGAGNKSAQVPTPAMHASTPDPENQVSFGGYFPIGVYDASYWELEKWKGRGINTVVGVGIGGGLEQTQSEVNRLGMRIIREPRSTPASDIGESNLFAWEQTDEPDGIYAQTSFAQIQSIYNNWKNIDQNRDVWINFIGDLNQFDTSKSECQSGWSPNCESGDSWYKKYTAGADWLSGDTYPVNTGQPNNLNKIGGMIDNLRRIGDGKPTMAIIEAADYDTANSYPGPTPAQLRAEVWNAIIHGARSITYFTVRVSPSFLFDAMTPEVVTEMTQQNNTITSLAGILQTQINPPGTSVNSSAPLDIGWRDTPSGKYFMALNLSDTARSNLSFTVSGIGSVTSAAVYGENRTVPVVNGVITDNYAAYGVHIYQVVTPPTGTCTFTGPKAGEIDGVSPVSAHDLSLLLSHFNQTNNSYPAGDFDSDCSITAHDLSMLLANWGK